MQRKWWTLIAVSVATFMLLLDITVVNVALPVDPRGPRRQLHRPAVGGRRLRADPRRARADRRLAGRPARTPAGLRRRAWRSSPPPRCSCALAPDPTFLNLARALQGVGGAVMFAVSLALIAQEFAAGRERGDGDGHLRRDDRRRGRDRPARRRRADRRARLGVDLLPQRPDRAGGDRDHPAEAAREPRPERDRASTGPASRRSAPRCFLLVLALVRGNDEGWGSTLIVSLFAGSARAARRLRGDRAARRASRCCRSALFRRPVVHRRPARRVRGLGLAVRALPLPDAVPAELPRLLALRGRAALPADHGRELPRRADRRGAALARPGAADAQRRPRRRRRRACC